MGLDPVIPRFNHVLPRIRAEWHLSREKIAAQVLAALLIRNGKPDPDMEAIKASLEEEVQASIHNRDVEQLARRAVEYADALLHELGY